MRARRLWLQAGDLELRLEFDSALSVLRAAQRADPTFFPAHHTFIRLMRYRGAFAPLRSAYASMRLPEPIGGCLRTVTGVSLNADASMVPALLELERRYGPSPCTALHLAVALPAARPPAEREPAAREAARRAVQYAAQMPDSWLLYGGVFARAQRMPDALRFYGEAAKRAQHPAERLVLEQRLEDLLVATGDTAAARTRWRAFAAAAARDGRPWLKLRVAQLGEPPRNERTWRLGAVRAAQLARAYGDPWSEFQSLILAGSLTSDAGDPATALPYLDRAVSLANRLAVPHFRLLALRMRGRVYSKLGKLDQAERDLKAAINAGDVVELAIAEAYHNLAHTYEGAGRFNEAVSAVDHFIALTRPYRYEQPRMMSLHDAGVIRWKAGWHAAADAAFREMVTAVDEQDANHYWAGEYFERTGELRRALHYYERGARRGGADQSLNLGGLTRVLAALGMRDSAEAMARSHDRAISNQLDIPLLPTVLAQHGHRDEAIRIAREWMERRVREGSVEGAARAGAQLASLLLEAKRAADALAVARQTERFARQLNLTDQLIEAQRFAGLAELQLGHSKQGLALLQQGAALARARPTTHAVLTTHLALGNALAGTGDFAGAMAAYERAAQSVERVTGRLELDQDRVRFRSLNLAPFDGALSALQTQPHTSVDVVLRWSQRRKAAALAIAAGVSAQQEREAPRPLSLREVGRRLAPDQALVDYQIAGQSISAIVVTPTGSQMIRLPLRADSLLRITERLRQPLLRAIYQGRIDLARAPFDLAAAHSLHQGLLQPLEPALATARRLLIVPDGVLHYVPFDALVSATPAGALYAPSYLGARFAIDRFEISYLPAAQFLHRMRPSLVRTGVLAVSRGAPGGDREVELIRRNWRGRVSVLRDARATESRVQAEASGYSILHFATHAVADDRDPLASHLQLERDQSNDGFLHVSEISARPTPARLVVLSACETVRGPLFAGEGFVGLARAFLAGGAGAVVATAWPIGPQTADLMSEFYGAMAAGAPPAAALRRARLVLRSDERTAHPFYWAGVLIIGE